MKVSLRRNNQTNSIWKIDIAIFISLYFVSLLSLYFYFSGWREALILAVGVILASSFLILFKSNCRRSRNLT
jgi:hypothetical protein